MRFSEFIKTEREKQNMSRYKLAKIAGVTSRAISYWEEDKRSISLENAEKLANALNVTYKIGGKSEKGEQQC